MGDIDERDKIENNEEGPDDELDENAYRSSSRGDEKSKTPIFVVLMFVFLIAGVAGGVAIGKFALKDGSSSSSKNDDDEVYYAKINQVLPLEDKTIKAEIDKKIDAYENSAGLNSKSIRLRPFSSGDLSKIDMLEIAFYYMADSDLESLNIKNHSIDEIRGRSVDVPIMRVMDVIEEIFGLSYDGEDDYYVDEFYDCGTKLMATYTPDKENKQYVVSVPENATCGGISDGSSRDSHVYQYEKVGDNNYVYVTTALGSTKGIDAEAFRVIDLYGDFDAAGEPIRRIENDFDLDDYVNEETKDQFTDYQYIFRWDGANWVLEGLYPIGTGVGIIDVE